MRVIFNRELMMNRRNLILGLGATLMSGQSRAQQLMGQPMSGGRSYLTIPMQVAGGTISSNPLSNRLGITKSGAAMIVDWGDGSATTQSNSPSHNYLSTQLFTATISSPDGWAGVTQFQFSPANGNGVSPYTGQAPPSNPGQFPTYNAPMPSLAAMVNLQQFLSGDTWWGDAFPHPDLSIFQALQHIDIQGNAFTGNPPLLTSMPNLLFIDWHICFANASGVTLPSASGCPNLQHFESHGNRYLNFPSFASNTQLNWFGFGNGCFATCTSSCPDFSACTLLTNFVIDSNALTGTVPSFAACTLLTNWSAHGHAFSGVTAGSWATQPNLATLDLYFGNLTAAAVNQVLADCVASLSLPGRVACTVTLNGNLNAAPTGTGITNKATLISAGWTVTTN